MTLRIAVFQDEWFPVHGGGLISSLELCESLVTQYDVEIDIFTRQMHHEGETYKENDRIQSNIRVVRLPPCTESSSTLGKLSYFLTPLLYCPDDYDLVHAHTYIPGFPASIFGKLRDIPSVYTVRGTSVDAESSVSSVSAGVVGKLKKRVERFLVSDLDYTTVISVNRDFIDRFGDKHDDIRFIPNGVDTEKFNADPPTDVTEFLFVGRLVGKKGVNVLIESFEKVYDERPEATLTIVGEGPLGDKLREKVEQRGLSSAVTFAGRVPYEKIPSYYQDADVLVLPSEWEGHPRVMIEAWSSSRPVLGTNIEGIEEFINEDETGWMVPFDNPEHLAEQMIWCVDHPDAVKQCGRNGRRVVEEEYSWDAIADRTYSLYLELVDEHDV
jgi:glycosyltransferase involved in cell wall biosynthesis